MNEKANVSKELNAKHKKVLVPPHVLLFNVNDDAFLFCSSTHHFLQINLVNCSDSIQSLSDSIQSLSDSFFEKSNLHFSTFLISYVIT